MKTKFQKTLLALAFLLVANFVMAQAPQGIPYQAVARDNAGNLIKNQPIAVRFSIHDGTANGTVVFTETHSVTTDALGLFSVNIGSGTSTSTLTNVNWGSGAKFTQVELDVTGGSNFIDMGTTQMMSVPYALYAGTANVPGVPGPQGPTGATGSVGSVTAVSGTSNANGATISGGNLTLTPADATNGGIVTNGTQTFAGNKTFSGTTTASSIKKSGGTASQILMADGSTTQTIQTIRGCVNRTGTISRGSGFVVNKTSVGNYQIIFTTPFTEVPIIVVTAINNIFDNLWVFINLVNITTSSAQIKFANPQVSAFVDIEFSFIAMAP